MDGLPYVLVEPEEARRAADSEDSIQIVDVREVLETDALRVEGALNLPLSRLRVLADRLDRTRPVYLLCRSGNRAASAAAQLRTLGHHDVFVVRGGLEAWMAAGHPVLRGKAAVWSLERQVRFAAGLIVFAGIALGLLWHRTLLGLSAAVGLGLMYSALTDTCAMAHVLTRMPWNQGSAAARAGR